MASEIIKEQSKIDPQLQKIVAVFDQVAADYDKEALRWFPFCADKMMDILLPSPGMKVLDVAAGTGALTIAAAQRIRPVGRVYAIDLADGMLSVLEAKTRVMGLENIDLFNMNGDQLEFRDQYFDAVCCSFGLFFMPDMQQALREWWRVLKPGGRIIFSSFAQGAFQPMKGLFFDRIEGYGVEFPKGRGQLVVDRLQDQVTCTKLLEGANCSDVQLHHAQVGYHLQRVEDWWDVLWGSGFRGLLLQLDEKERLRFRSEHFKEVSGLAKENGIWMDVGVNLTVGRRA
ncbi:MAG TPA: methyltransferase domain-containing protein [Acidiferrobacteraceae bacterium]|nr:methyltransferase domain-containing protein [Acidiferrobacteraceae bacterium]